MSRTSNLIKVEGIKNPYAEKNLHWQEYDETNPECIITQMMHIYNLPFLDFDKRMKDLEEICKKNGWSETEIENLKIKAAQRSNWMNNKYVAERFESKHKRFANPVKWR